MKMLNTCVGVFIALCLIGSQTSCKKETDTYDLYPIKITSADTLGFTKLSWTKIETADFLEYIVVRSSGDSIANFSELSTSKGASIVGRISTAKQSDFFDSFNGSFNVGRVYYRVFARLKNRTISSANYLINNDLSVINVPVPSEVLRNSINPNLVYLNAPNSGLIALYDMDKDSILARTSTGISNTRVVFASDNTNGNNAELVQVVSGSTQLFFRDAKTLDVKFTLVANYYVYNVEAIQDGFVCIHTSDPNKQFKIIRLSDHAVVSTQSGSIDTYNFYYSGVSMNKVPNSNSILFSENNSSSPNFATLTYDAQGNFTSAKLVGRLLNNNTSGQINKISPQGSYYFLLGQLFSAPFDPNKPLNVFVPNNYTDFVFKQDDSKFYLLRRDFNAQSGSVNVVEEYNLPSGKLSRSLSAKVVGRSVLYKNKIYIFGANNNGLSSQTILQKIQL